MGNLLFDADFGPSSKAGRAGGAAGRGDRYYAHLVLTSGMAFRRWRRGALLDGESACFALRAADFGPVPEAMAEGRAVGRGVCFSGPY